MHLHMRNKRLYCVVFKDFDVYWFVQQQQKKHPAVKKNQHLIWPGGETWTASHPAFNGLSPSHFLVSFPLSSNKQDADGARLARAAEEWRQIAEGALCGRDLSVFFAVPVFVFRSPLNPLCLPLPSFPQAGAFSCHGRWLNQHYSILYADIISIVMIIRLFVLGIKSL